jgi:Domain of unknown function (DUF3471)
VAYQASSLADVKLMAKKRGHMVTLAVGLPVGRIGCLLFEGARDAHSKPSLSVEEYAGVYKDAWYRPITIRMENGSPVISFDHRPGRVGDLHHWRDATFKAHWCMGTIEGAFVTFSFDPEGSIVSARMAVAAG